MLMTDWKIICEGHIKMNSAIKSLCLPFTMYNISQ